MVVYWIPTRVIEEWLREDIPFGDLTTNALGIADKPGVAEVIVRESGVICGLEEASKIYGILGASCELFVKDGDKVGPGALALKAKGSAKALHAAWRAAQVVIEYASGVATKTWRLVSKAKSVNPKVVIATTRKAPPGARSLYFKAVLSGGGIIHRASLSETILIFHNHVSLVGGFEEALRKALEARRRWPEKKLAFEVGSIEEALKAAEIGIDEVQLDHIGIDELKRLVPKLRELNPQIVIAVAGGIDEHNIEEYASTGVDVIVTSAPYHAKPLNITTKIYAAT